MRFARQEKGCCRCRDVGATWRSRRVWRELGRYCCKLQVGCIQPLTRNTHAEQAIQNCRRRSTPKTQSIKTQAPKTTLELLTPLSQPCPHGSIIRCLGTRNRGGDGAGTCNGAWFEKSALLLEGSFRPLVMPAISIVLTINLFVCLPLRYCTRSLQMCVLAPL